MNQVDWASSFPADEASFRDALKIAIVAPRVNSKSSLMAERGTSSRTQSPRRMPDRGALVAVAIARGHVADGERLGGFHRHNDQIAWFDAVPHPPTTGPSSSLRDRSTRRNTRARQGPDIFSLLANCREGTSFQAAGSAVLQTPSLILPVAPAAVTQTASCQRRLKTDPFAAGRVLVNVATRMVVGG